MLFQSASFSKLTSSTALIFLLERITCTSFLFKACPFSPIHHSDWPIYLIGLGCDHCQLGHNLTRPFFLQTSQNRPANPLAVKRMGDSTITQIFLGYIFEEALLPFLSCLISPIRSNWSSYTLKHHSTHVLVRLFSLTVSKAWACLCVCVVACAIACACVSREDETVGRL